MNVLEGKLLAEGQRIGIVAGRFNEFITSKLLGVQSTPLYVTAECEKDITLAWVPGAFEIPLTAQKRVESRKIRCRYLPGSGYPGSDTSFRYGGQ